MRLNAVRRVAGIMQVQLMSGGLGTTNMIARDI